MREKFYIAIDLKSFYASVECLQRGLDPLRTCLVVADQSRTDKTICLAVSPALKAFGIPGRPRLFEVIQKVSEVNARRRLQVSGQRLTGSSTDGIVLQENPTLAVDYIVAPPRMALYMQASAAVYQVYLQFIAPEDIHAYSVDEVFIDATPYLKTYRMTPCELATKLVQEVYTQCGITATAGVGTNLYLCKVAMDIVAKHSKPDAHGVRIAQLDELRYRQLLWDHQPITDFWRIGPGYARKLRKVGLRTMGDIARCSLGSQTEFHNEDLLYRLFGVQAELLIDHAWGYENCTIRDIKSYRPSSTSLGCGQVLTNPYTFDKARIVIREMAESLTLDLVDKGYLTNQVVVTVGYDVENLQDPQRRIAYTGAVVTDHYGRQLPAHGHGSHNFPRYTASSRQIADAVVALFDRITDKNLLIRRLNITMARLQPENHLPVCEQYQQMDLFASSAAEPDETRERRRQQAILAIRKKYGKNAILRCASYQDGATARERNAHIGGHHA